MFLQHRYNALSRKPLPSFKIKILCSLDDELLTLHFPKSSNHLLCCECRTTSRLRFIEFLYKDICHNSRGKIFRDCYFLILNTKVFNSNMDYKILGTNHMKHDLNIYLWSKLFMAHFEICPKTRHALLTKRRLFLKSSI